MKKSYYKYVILVFGLISLASCSDQAEEALKVEPAPQRVQLVFQAMPENSGPDTRTYLADGQVGWHSGDKISVFPGNSSTAENDQFQTNNEGTNIPFWGTVSQAAAEVAEDYYGLYPYDVSATIVNTNNTTIVTAFSNEQTAVDNSFAQDANITVAKADEGALEYNTKIFHFKNVCGLVSFAIPAGVSDEDMAAVTKAVLEGSASEELTGKLQISNIESVDDFNDDVDGKHFVTSLLNDPTPGTYITLNAPTGDSPGFKRSVTYYFVVRPIVFPSGFTIKLYKGDVLVGTITKSGSNIPVKRSMITDAGDSYAAATP